MTYSLLNIDNLEERLPAVFGIPLIRIVNVVALVAVFVINGLATGTTFNNLRTGDISDLLPNYFVPQGYAFSIWGVIYFFLAAWGVYQLLPRTADAVTYNKGVGYLFPLNAACNVTWIIIWAYRQEPLSVVIILSILLNNAVIYYRLKTQDPEPSWAYYICGHVGFSFYTAWLIGASFVNIWAVSSKPEAAYLGQTIAAFVLLGVIEIFVTLWAGDPIITGVGAWTLIANYIKNRNVPQLSESVLALAIILAIVTGLVWIHRIWRVVAGRRSGSGV